MGRCSSCILRCRPNESDVSPGVKVEEGVNSNRVE